MFAFIKKYKRIFIKLLVILIFLTFLITLIILKSNVDICETWTRSFSRFYQSTFIFPSAKSFSHTLIASLSICG